MPELSDIVNVLRNRERLLEAELEKVRAAMAALEDVANGTTRRKSGGARSVAKNPNGAKRGGRRKGYKLSAATRAKMATAQQARWAARKS